MPLVQVSGGEDPLADVPPPSAELVLLRVTVQSFLHVSGKRKGEAFLRHMAETLKSEEAVALLLPDHPPARRIAVTKARRGAVAWLRMLLPTFWLGIRR